MQHKWLSILFVVIAILAIVAQPAAAVSTTVVISEFRTRGPGVAPDFLTADDQFIELYNLSPVAVDIHGYSINTWDPVNDVWLGIAQIADSIDPDLPIMLQPFGHYLIVNGSGYSGATDPDAGFFAPIPADAVGIALIGADGLTVVDAVATIGGVNPYQEGGILTPMASDIDQSYERLPATVNLGHINTADTDDNSADFIFNNGSSNPESQTAGSPTAVTLRDLTAQAQSPATWLWPVALLIVLGGALIVSRRRA
jgi:hypothetical protein